MVTGYFSSDHLCIVLDRDTEFKNTKGTGGLIGRPDAFVNVPGISHRSDYPLAPLTGFREFPKGRKGLTELAQGSYGPFQRFQNIPDLFDGFYPLSSPSPLGFITHDICRSELGKMAANCLNGPACNLRQPCRCQRTLLHQENHDPVNNRAPK